MVPGTLGLSSETVPRGQSPGTVPGTAGRSPGEFPINVGFVGIYLAVVHEVRAFFCINRRARRISLHLTSDRRRSNISNLFANF